MRNRKILGVVIYLPKPEYNTWSVSGKMTPLAIKEVCSKQERSSYLIKELEEVGVDGSVFVGEKLRRNSVLLQKQ